VNHQNQVAGIEGEVLVALGEDYSELREAVRRICQGYPSSYWRDLERESSYPTAFVHALTEAGFLGALIPEEYGGSGLPLRAAAVILEEINASGCTASAAHAQMYIMGTLLRHGSEEQKQKFLPKMARGEWIGCFGLTEADFGSNPAGLRTRAVRDGQDFVITGNKMWITNGGISDLAIVWAKLDDPSSKSHGRIVGFIVEREHGYQAPEVERKYSLRASNTSELVFDECRVPARNQLQIAGLKGPIGCLAAARYGISWGAIGAAQACFDEARRYSLTRIQFDQPIASFQLVQAKLVKMHQEITKAQLLAWRLGRLKEEGRARIQQISLAKMNNVAMALDCARTTRDILGGSGITLEYHCGRHMMNLESVFTYEGTDDIHRLILGEEITGIPAYR